MCLHFKYMVLKSFWRWLLRSLTLSHVLILLLGDSDHLIAECHLNSSFQQCGDLSKLGKAVGNILSNWKSLLLLCKTKLYSVGGCTTANVLLKTSVVLWLNQIRSCTSFYCSKCFVNDQLSSVTYRVF